jgi:RNA polymerase sigma factor (sigma-70 family)
MNAEEQALYDQYEYLVPNTIRRLFPNTQKFASSKHLDVDDLMQFGRIGLWNGITNFDHSKGNMKFRNYLINRIRWTVYRYIQTNEMNQSYYKFDYKKDDNPRITLLSMSHKPISEEDDKTFYDIIPSETYEDVDSEVESKIKIDKLLSVLSDGDREIALMKMNEDLNNKEIGERYGISRQAINIKLKRIQKILRKQIDMNLVNKRK